MMKAIEQYFHVVLFITLYKVVLAFKPVDETQISDHSVESYNKQYFHVVLLIAVNCAVQRSIKF